MRGQWRTFGGLIRCEARKQRHVCTIVLCEIARFRPGFPLRQEVALARFDHLATKEDVAKSTLTQVKWLIGVVAVPTVITLINMIIQLTG